jgi:hypothetical protein
MILEAKGKAKGRGQGDRESNVKQRPTRGAQAKSLGKTAANKNNEHHFLIRIRS